MTGRMRSRNLPRQPAVEHTLISMRITKLQHSGLWLLGLVVFIGGFAAQARAQERIGVRAGVSGDPNQFYLGVHVETRPVADRLRFRPNIEIGLGDNETLVALNLEFVYPIPLPNSPWRVYSVLVRPSTFTGLVARGTQQPVVGLTFCWASPTLAVSSRS